MITATKEFRFEAAHRLPRHLGQCSNIHGHSYRVVVTVSEKMDAPPKPPESEDMVMDFQDLGSIVNGILGEWDHSIILQETDSLVDVLNGYRDSGEDIKIVTIHGPPTAENMAELLAIRMLPAIEADHCYLEEVQVWETAKCHARWKR